MLTPTSRLDVMNRLGRAMADPTRSRILLSVLATPGYPAELARDLDLTRTNVSNHLSCLRGCGLIVATSEGRRTRYEIADPHLTQGLRQLLEAVVAVDEGAPCMDEKCACCA
ncbi:Cd(II)/Pb(II)-sensing metalloregulatory transcriptional regulator CmtR [Microbacterium sp. TWP3-1-2b2]|uniref:Cd(II)/Pb(II)-sensing metalloregulatory transcriptional regulator CmtR n=1 Tax=Microbacterium sp. TWP3-1-2b2 TaxID=2804651 RepID=UPI003CEC9AAB